VPDNSLRDGGQGRNRTTDTRIFSQAPMQAEAVETTADLQMLVSDIAE
jgi:hypothetical protein